jgi:DNA-directed RNA polymerase specialized sigma24 family protein
MRYGEDRMPSCEEIASRLGRPVKAIYNLVNRARLALAQCVEQEQMRYASGA